MVQGHCDSFNGGGALGCHSGSFGGILFQFISSVVQLDLKKILQQGYYGAFHWFVVLFIYIIRL